MRLIDADVLLDAICGCFNIMEAQGIDITVAQTIAKGVIDAAPAVDAAPVVHGRWISHPTEPLWDVCSACGTGCKRRENDDGAEIQHCYQYCPWCGARMMDGGDNDEAD